MRQIGWQHQIRPSNFREAVTATDPQAFVLYNALGKARDVAQHYASGVVLGADTVVVHAGELLGKPKDRAEAASMLRSLSDDWHQVFTAVALIDCASGREVSAVVCTRVHMRAISASELERYLDTDEPYDKAGAYGIQGRAAIFIDQIDGCYFNVVGLPLSKLTELMRQLDTPR